MQTQVSVEVRTGLHIEKRLLAAGYAEGKYADRVDGCREQRHDTQRILKADASHVKTTPESIVLGNAEKTGKTRQVTRMGNKSGSGPFTPLVIVARNILGKKDFNQFRGKAISLHSQGRTSPTQLMQL